MVAQILKDVFMFYDQFYKLCKARGKKPTPVAKELGCTSSNVALWKKGSTPRAPVLAKIAEYFDVTEQYLLFGDGSDVGNKSGVTSGSNPFWENFVSLCADSDKRPSTVAAELHFSSGSVTSWKSGTQPRETTLKKIADYFGVTTDYLLGIDKKAPAAQPGDELSAEFREKYSKLPPEQQKLIEAMIDSLLSGKS